MERPRTNNGRRNQPLRPSGFPPMTLKLRITGLPPKCDTGVIYNYFQRFGDIDHVRIESADAGIVSFRLRRVKHPSPSPQVQKIQAPFLPLSVTRSVTHQSASPVPANMTFITCAHQMVKGVPHLVHLQPICQSNPSVVSPLDKHRQLPSFVTIVSAAASIGVAIADNEMVSLRNLASMPNVPQTQISLNTMIDRENSDLIVKFPIVTAGQILPHQLRIKFAYIEQVRFATGPDPSTRQIIFSFKYPPKFSYVDANFVGVGADGMQWSKSRALKRVTNIDTDLQARAQLPVSLVSTGVIIDLGRWLTWAFKIEVARNNKVLYDHFEAVLRAYNVDTTFGPFNIRAPVGQIIWHSFDLNKSGQINRQNALAILQEQAFPVLPFELRYRLGICLSKRLFYDGHVTKEFLIGLQELNETRALDLLDNLADSNRKLRHPMQLFEIAELRTKRRRHRVPKTCTLMHSVTITPTAVLLSPVQTEVSNRVTRKYAHLSDRFLRVRFSDELYYGSLQHQQDEREDEVYARVRRVLVNGLQLAGRHYVFLACGNSQFREHGAYFFCPTDTTVTVNSIRQFMGYFSHIREIPKFISRIGQCFSTTRAISSIGYQPKIVEIPDVERNGYTFTDGVGKLSNFLAHMIAQEMRLTETPSLFQFRMGGCKGVLAIDPLLTDRTVCIRPSQRKFNSDFNQLEIIRTSSFASAYLNRQIILVLSSLGIDDEVFIAKICKQLETMNKALTDDTLAIGGLMRNVDYNQITTVIAKMIAIGMRGDPFVDSMLHLWRAWSVKFLKEKTNMFIQDGAFLLGCVDESATLAPTEIFVQVPDPTSEKNEYRIIIGDCIIVRNPALHPGDIRIVKAVDCAALHHLRDVVVVSQLGDRDLANMCAGGDLDGDDFLVIWDPDLIPDKQHEPMDYTAPPPITSHGPVRQSDIIDFFCKYMKNNSLGSIAVAHRAWADYHTDGVKNEQCLALANLHSMAVDYPKTGVPAIMSPELKVKRYPHWLNKRFNTYKSRKVLGKLYDEVERVEFQPQYHRGFDKRILLVQESYKLPDDGLQAVMDLKSEYDEDVRRIMAQFGVQTEFEIWSAFVLEHNREIKEYKFGEELGRLMNALKHHYRDACFELMGITNVSPDREQKMIALVSTLYKLTADQVHDFTSDMEWHASQDSHTPMLSMPWVFQEELLALATIGGQMSEQNDQGGEIMTLSQAMTANNITCARATKAASMARDSRFDRVNSDGIRGGDDGQALVNGHHRDRNKENGDYAGRAGKMKSDNEQIRQDENGVGLVNGRAVADDGHQAKQEGQQKKQHETVDGLAFAAVTLFLGSRTPNTRSTHSSPARYEANDDCSSVTSYESSLFNTAMGNGSGWPGVRSTAAATITVTAKHAVDAVMIGHEKEDAVMGNGKMAAGETEKMAAGETEKMAAGETEEKMQENDEGREGKDVVRHKPKHERFGEEDAHERLAALYGGESGDEESGAE